MNVNLFFLIIGLGLIAIYLLFRPMVIEKREKREVALLDLKQFTVYELKPGSLHSILQGSSAERFSDRYEVHDANYTDHSHPYVQTMVSDFALYKGEKIYLEKNVRYEREDGLAFISNEAFYNQKNGVAKTKGAFTILQNQDNVKGRALYYNSNTGKIKAKKVTGNYTLITQKENR